MAINTSIVQDAATTAQVGGSTAVSETLLVSVFNSTGMDEQEVPTVKVYPNPANDVIYVETNTNGNAKLRVIDLSGRVVFESEIPNSACNIATSALGGSGIYTMQVIQNDIVTNVRIVVMP